MPEMQEKWGVSVSISDIKRVENYPDFDKLVHIRRGGSVAEWLGHRI